MGRYGDGVTIVLRSWATEVSPSATHQCRSHSPTVRLIFHSVYTTLPRSSLMGRYGRGVPIGMDAWAMGRTVSTAWKGGTDGPRQGGSFCPDAAMSVACRLDSTILQRSAPTGRCGRGVGIVLDSWGTALLRTAMRRCSSHWPIAVPVPLRSVTSIRQLSAPERPLQLPVQPPQAASPAAHHQPPAQA